MARVEAPGVADHRDEAGLLLSRDHRLGVLQAVGERDLDLHVLAGLAGTAIAWAACIWVGVARITASRPGSFRVSESSVVYMGDAVFSAASFVLSSSRPTSEIDLDPVDQLDRVEMLEAEGAGARERDLDESWSQENSEAEDRFGSSLRGAKRRSNPCLRTPYADCFASLAMTV